MINKSKTCNNVYLLYYIVYYVVLMSVIYFLFIGVPIWDGLIIWTFNRIKYSYGKYGYLIFLLPEIILTTLPLIIFTVFHNRKYYNKKVEKRSYQIALVIPCHKAQDVIKNTLEKALKLFDGRSIYVIDNGNTSIPTDNTRHICNGLGVNYIWCDVGSKLAAIYVGTKAAVGYKYIMQIDDDMELEQDMTFPICNDIDCIAYTISGISKFKKNNLLQRCQDVEYKISGFIKALQSWVGNTIFAHGAISLWKRDSLIKVLHQHPMYPISDDWFTGFIANCMGMRIEVCDQKFIGTDTPSVLFYGGRLSGYGNATLLHQRLTRWYALIGIQIMNQIYYIFFVWKFSWKRIIMQKLILLWYMFVMIIITFRYIILGYSLFLSPIFPLIMFSVNIGIWLIHFSIINYKLLVDNERIPFYMIFIQPIYTMYDILILGCAMIYGIFYKIPNVLFTPRLKLSENDKIQSILNKLPIV